MEINPVFVLEFILVYIIITKISFTIVNALKEYPELCPDIIEVQKCIVALFVSPIITVIISVFLFCK